MLKSQCTKSSFEGAERETRSKTPCKYLIMSIKRYIVDCLYILNDNSRYICLYC